MKEYQKIIPRARIGYIIPSSNRMVEVHMQRYMPEGVMAHYTRIRMTNQHEAPLDQLIPRICDAAEMLAESLCNPIVLQCTGTSMSGGLDMEKVVMSAIEKATGSKAISAASSVNAALQALNAKKLVFISESPQAGHDKKHRFLVEAGYDLLKSKAVGLSGTNEYCIMPPELWYDTALEQRDDDADVYFLSCANIHATDTIEALEKGLKKPVVTSNQAAIWYALRTAGINDNVPALGHLMTLQPATQAAAAE
jgi:maleate isomerase